MYGFWTPAAPGCSTGSIRPAHPAPMRCWPWCFRATRASPWRRSPRPSGSGTRWSRSPTRRSARSPSGPTWCCPRRSARSSSSICTPARWRWPWCCCRRCATRRPSRCSAGWRSSKLRPPGGTFSRHREAMTMSEIRAARGSAYTAMGWPQEAAKRMLMNNLDPDVAERPQDLVVYGGTGRAARDWPSFHAIVRELDQLKDDETLLVQSGRPVGVFRTHEWAPRVLIANSNLVGDWATWPEFRRLEKLGLTMYGQMTAGSWIYIGTQGILQGTYETFAAVAAKRFGGTLAGTLTLTAGCGGMGGAQPLAVTMNDGVCLIVDIDRARLQRRVATRYLDTVAEDLDAAVREAEAAKRDRVARSIGVVGNAAEVFPELLLRGVEIDIVTDQTSAHDPLSYVPVGVDVADAPAYAAAKPEEYTDRARASM